MKPRVRKVLEGIYAVGGGNLTTPEDAAAFLVLFGQNAALIDAGTGHAHEQLAANVRACLPEAVDKLDYLLLTHCHFDHTGGANPIAEEFSCPTFIHGLDADAIEQGDSKRTAATWYGEKMPRVPVSIVMEGDSQNLTLGSGQIQAIHTPGHTPGSVVFLTEKEGQIVLFGQDVHGPLFPEFGSDETLYKKSLEAMIAMDADVLCEGHYGILFGRDEVARFIRQFL